jgi:hypothetical protein
MPISEALALKRAHVKFETGEAQLIGLLVKVNPMP